MLPVLAILCPPLAALLTGGPLSAVKNVGLTLLFYVPGVLHARRKVEQYSAARQYDVLMRLLDDKESRPRSTRTQAA